MDENEQHFKRPVTCGWCGWIGLSGELIGAGSASGLLCPKCGEHDMIEYVIPDAPTTVQ